MKKKKKAAMFSNGARYGNSEVTIDYVYNHGRKADVAELVDMHSVIINSNNFEKNIDILKNIEVIFSTWGMLALTKAQIKQMPKLKAVFYAAGATGGFDKALIENGIQLFSAWQANAVPVAEFCLGQILLSAKGFFRNTQQYKPGTDQNLPFRGNGSYGETVALIGAGAISVKTKEFLEPFNFNIITVPSRKENRTVSLEEAFKQAYIISNHLPDRDDNKKVLNGKLFSSMRHGATFINTGRGAQVNEEELIAVFKERPDLTALLDVTYPEPPENDSELFSLPNVVLSSHIAGSINDEVVRLADYMIDEFKRWENNEKLEYEIK